MLDNAIIYERILNDKEAYQFLNKEASYRKMDNDMKNFEYYYFNGNVTYETTNVEQRITENIGVIGLYGGMNTSRNPVLHQNGKKKLYNKRGVSS